jgi:hypothetical protein
MIFLKKSSKVVTGSDFIVTFVHTSVSVKDVMMKLR